MSVEDGLHDDLSERLEVTKALLKRVLAAPTNHRGIRSSPPDTEPFGGLVAVRYTAKRLPDKLLDEIREAVR